MNMWMPPLVLGVLLCVLGYGAAQCPPAEALGPCVCFEDATNQLALQCRSVAGWEEVADIFVNNGLTYVASVDIIASPDLTDLPASAFAQVGVGAIRFYNTGLQSLRSDVFSEETASQLHSLYIKHNSAFTALENDVPGSLPNLESLFCSYNMLGSLSGALLPNKVPYMDFSHDGINMISPNYFYDSTNLTQILLAFNELTSDSLPPGCFNMSGQGEDFYLDLGWNQLTQGIPVQAFGDRVPRELVLSHNNITTLDALVFSHLMDQMVAAYPNTNSYILLDHNELGCECDMAWIVEHPNRDLLQLAECADGRLVSGLTMVDFSHC